MMNAPVSRAKRFAFTSCGVFHIADGKIVEHRGMGDVADVLAQLKGWDGLASTVRPPGTLQRNGRPLPW
jgi:hypothetical protein